MHGRVIYDPERLGFLSFNPITANNFTGPSYDLDPDQHFLSVSDSKYYTQDEFNSITQSWTSLFSLMHINARSIRHNLSELTDFLTTLDNRFPIIGISDTWLTSNPDGVHIDGYSFHHKCRADKHGGGVGIFVNSSIKHTARDDLSFFEPEILESVLLEIDQPHQGNIIVGVIYGPPGTDPVKTMSKVSELLAKISKEPKSCYLLGDFNFDLLKYQQRSSTSKFLDCMFSHSFLPLISQPTRITSDTATLIDNIFTNHLPHAAIIVFFFFTDISDHLPIFTLLSQAKSVRPKTRVIRRH